MREHIRAVRAQTDGPFAVGFITAFIPGFEANFQVALDEKVPLIMLSFGDPRSYAERARAVGVPVACQVQTLESARWALEAEAEFIVAQGTEAGGHGGYLSTLPCLSMVLGIAGETPVLASGGIASGRSLAAILAAGAEGAMLGTALLATPESTDVSEEYKNQIVASDGEDTVFSTAWDIVSGAPWPEGIAVRTGRSGPDQHGAVCRLRERRTSRGRSYRLDLRRGRGGTEATFPGPRPLTSASNVGRLRIGHLHLGLQATARRMMP